MISKAWSPTLQHQYWECIRIAHSQASHLTRTVRNSGWSPAICDITSSPADSHKRWFEIKLPYSFPPTTEKSDLHEIHLPAPYYHYLTPNFSRTVLSKLPFQSLLVIMYRVALFNSHASSHQRHSAMVIATPTFLQFSSLSLHKLHPYISNQLLKKSKEPQTYQVPNWMNYSSLLFLSLFISPKPAPPC